ncbi:MAG: hypothetical protein U1F40_09525 [Turneriella sp.]
MTCYTGAGNYTYRDDYINRPDAELFGDGLWHPGCCGHNLPSSTTTFTGDGKPYIVAIYPVDNGTVLVEWPGACWQCSICWGRDYLISGVTITGAALYPAGTDPSRYVQLTINPTPPDIGHFLYPECQQPDGQR